jgi:hypothetical protein
MPQAALFVWTVSKFIFLFRSLALRTSNRSGYPCKAVKQSFRLAALFIQPERSTLSSRASGLASPFRLRLDLSSRGLKYAIDVAALGVGSAGTCASNDRHRPLGVGLKVDERGETARTGRNGSEASSDRPEASTGA